MLKNIIIINDSAAIDGGASNIAISSAIKLSQLGYKVVFFSGFGTPELNMLQNNIENISTEQNYYADKGNFFKIFFGRIKNFKAINLLNKLLDKYDISDTIIHVHSWHRCLTSDIFKIALKKNFKIIVTLHDYYSICPNGSLFDYKIKKICELIPLSLKCFLKNCDSKNYICKLWRYFLTFTQNYKKILCGIKNYICVSQMQKKILEPFFSKNEKFYFLKNPVIVKKENPIQVEKNENFIFCGQLFSPKGVIELTHISKDINIMITFIGDGLLKNEILKINKNAKITGWLSHEETKLKFKNARALILPSIMYETFGLVVAEAMSMGIPVIISDCCGIKEFIENGKTGFIFNKNDFNDLKEKILLLKNNDTLVKTMGKAAYNFYWKEDFTLENYINNLIKIYNSI